MNDDALVLRFVDFGQGPNVPTCAIEAALGAQRSAHSRRGLEFCSTVNSTRAQLKW